MAKASKTKSQRKKSSGKKKSKKRSRTNKGGSKAGKRSGAHVSADLPDYSLSDAFAELARRRTKGEIVVPPELLPKQQRRKHVRQTLREDHEFRIQNRPDGAERKFDKLAGSLWSFFRGTALLYFRDQTGSDAEYPRVLCNGDIHPENFGVMPNEDGAPFFGLNDFDEAHLAPFTWDIKRGAVGFYICCRVNGFSKSDGKDVVRSFVAGYVDGLEEFAKGDKENWRQLRMDNSPPMIRELLESAVTRREKFLDQYVDLDRGIFEPTDEIVPYSRHVSEFQEVMDRYKQEHDFDEEGRGGSFEVKDAAIKKDSGTASLGLDRYWVLLDGPTDEPLDDIILELKHVRTSALAGLVPSTDESPGEADRVAWSHQVHLVGGDRYYGAAEYDGRSFLVRERSPYKDDVDIDDLDEDEMCQYAGVCGDIVAQSHARSDQDTGALKGEAETKILESVCRDLFIADVVEFAHASYRRMKKDWKLFREDHEHGAFEMHARE